MTAYNVYGFRSPLTEGQYGQPAMAVVSDSDPDPLATFLEQQKPIILDEQGNVVEQPLIFSGENQNETFNNGLAQDTLPGLVIIPPLNTDVRFDDELPLYQPTEDDREGIPVSLPGWVVDSDEFNEPFTYYSGPLSEQSLITTYPSYLSGLRPVQQSLLVPRRGDMISVFPELSKNFQKFTNDKNRTKGCVILPSFLADGKNQKRVLVNFSWTIPSSQDPPEVKRKKRFIKQIPTAQHACGSCWAVSIADTFSDCLVVSGAVNWSPNISATYLMSCLPFGSFHQGCAGGNPATVVKRLENTPVADTSCIDYSWCSGDEELCKSVNSARHFDAKELAQKLNRNIPKPCGCYYGNIKKYLYKIDKNSAKVFHITNEIPVQDFRNTVKAQILDHGPVIGGYVVLSNFLSGYHTDPTINGGVYFDRADYARHKSNPRVPLRFSDQQTILAQGLHAISIVGWGVAPNVQFDTDQVGDVPYWLCRNSWGPNWGRNNGYFKCAMYPYNKTAQFDKQVMTSVGGPVGSVFFFTASTKPTETEQPQIQTVYNQQIRNRLRSDNYYRASPPEVVKLNTPSGFDPEPEPPKPEPPKPRPEPPKPELFNIPVVPIVGLGILSMFLFASVQNKR